MRFSSSRPGSTTTSTSSSEWITFLGSSSLSRNLGFTEIKTWPDSPEVIVLRGADDRRVDVHPVRFDDKGNGMQKIEGGKEWPYPAAGFAGAGTVGGRTVQCLTPEVQILCHAGYELDENDIRDLKALRARFGL